MKRKISNTSKAITPKSASNHSHIVELRMTKRVQGLLKRSCEASGRAANAEINHLLLQALTDNKKVVVQNDNESAPKRKRRIRPKVKVMEEVEVSPPKPVARRRKKQGGMLGELKDIIQDELSTLNTKFSK